MRAAKCKDALGVSSGRASVVSVSCWLLAVGFCYYAPTKGYSYCAVCVMDTSSKNCSSFGTKKFQGRNSLVPAEELFSSNGGTFRFLGRNLEVPTEDSGFPTEEN